MPSCRLAGVLAVLAAAVGCGGSTSSGQDASSDVGAQVDAAADASLVETCASYCQGCPDQFADTDCPNYCGAWGELAGVASCLTPWQAGWSCTLAAAICVERTVCSFDDGGAGGCGSSFFGECEPAGDSFANCVEAYCHDHDAICQEIATRYGLQY